MRATKLGRWARRAALVLVLGFGAAMVGGAAAYAESAWDFSSPSVTSSNSTSTTSPVTPNESAWD